MRIAVAVAVAWFLIVGLSVADESEAAIKHYDLNIPRQSLDAALKEFAQQTGLQIARFSDTVDGNAVVGPLTGQLSIEQALESLLTPNGLTYRVVNERTIAILKPGSDASTHSDSDSASINGSGAGSDLFAGGGKTLASQDDSARWWQRFRLAQTDTSAPLGSKRNAQAQDEKAAGQELPAPEERSKGIPEVLVEGSKILNMDILRDRDSPQPYVVFDRAAIERSGEMNLESFIKNRLPSSSQYSQQSQGANNMVVSARSEVNLRGLGTNQTLILIDGRRTAEGTLSSAQQPAINQVPLSAIERVEVLPATASGIYGGSATGGVINVILRRDYRGAEVKLGYENSFDSDAGIRQIDVSGGLNLEGGKTHILFAASRMDGNSLTTQDRDLQARGRAIIQANNPSFFVNNSVSVFASTPNIRSADGSNLVLDNGTPLNSPITYIPEGYLGSFTDQGNALVANAGRVNLDLGNTLQVNSGNNGNAPLYSTPTTESLMATVRRQFTSDIEAFLEGSATNVDSRRIFPAIFSAYTVSATAPNNPFTQAVRVSLPTTSGEAESYANYYTRRLAGGLIFKLPRDWMAEVDTTWSRTSQRYLQTPQPTSAATAAIGNGTIDILRDTLTYPIDLTPYLVGEPPAQYTVVPGVATLGDSTLRFSGPVGFLPAGRPTLTGLLEHRRTRFDEFAVYGNFGPGLYQYLPSRSQSVDSAYLEAQVPLVSELNALPGVRQLDVQLAGRIDQYETNTSNPRFSVVTALPVTTTFAGVENRVESVDPTIALRYSPVAGLTFRGSYGTGFLPPSIDQLSASTAVPTVSTPTPDPKRGGSPAIIGGVTTIVSGGNPDLGPEESESWSAGVIWTPAFIPGFRLSLDWISTEKTDNITGVGLTEIITQEDSGLYPGRLVRGPNLPTDPAGWAGPITLLDSSLINAARARVEAYDLQLDQTINISSTSVLTFFAVASWQPHHIVQILPTVPEVERAGIALDLNSVVLKFKANAGVTWDYGNWTAGWRANYFDSYLVATNDAIRVQNQGNGGGVSSQTYHDVFGSYRFGSEGMLKNTELHAGIDNVFDTRPPFDAGLPAYYSAFGDPRLTTYHFSVRRSF